MGVSYPENTFKTYFLFSNSACHKQNANTIQQNKYSIFYIYEYSFQYLLHTLTVDFGMQYLVPHYFDI